VRELRGSPSSFRVRLGGLRFAGEEAPFFFFRLFLAVFFEDFRLLLLCRFEVVFVLAAGSEGTPASVWAIAPAEKQRP